MKTPCNVLLFLTLAISALAQNKISPPPEIFQFTEAAARLPANFRGHYDVLLRFYSARSSVTVKGEFESRREYESRMSQIEMTILNLLGPGPFAVVMAPDEITFDADEESFDIVGKFQNHRLLTRTRERAGKSYVGQNAFGVKKRIRVRAYDNYYVQVENRGAMPSDVGSGNIGNIEMRLKMPRAEAIKNKAELRMLLVGQPADPYYSQDSRTQTPTIDDPEHSVTSTVVVHMKLSAIWLFDQPTGHIWAKWNANENSAAERRRASEFASLIGIPDQGRDGVGRVQILFKEKARYSPEALQAGTKGTVVLEVIFRADGSILIGNVIRGLPFGLTESAIEAAKRVRFQPATKDGRAVTTKGELEFTFY